MRLIMAVSSDGFLCRGPDDDMAWTGRTDKLLFRALTGVGRVCAAGATTHDLMHRPLMGRTLHRLSRGGYRLEDFARDYPDGWLLGGPTVAEAALRTGLVDEVHLCRSLTVSLAGGVPFSQFLPLYLNHRRLATLFEDVLLETYEVRP